MAESSITGRAGLNIDKIKEKLGAIQESNIKLKINSQEILNNIKSIQDELKTLVNKPYDIQINIDSNTKGAISDLKNQLNDISKQSKAISKTGGIPWNKVKGGFNLLYGSKQELQKELEAYKKNLNTKGSVIKSSRIDTIYGADGTETYKGIVEYTNEVGKAVKATMELNNATGKWYVKSTSVSENYAKQAEDLAKYSREIEKLNSDAFKGKNPLEGQFKEPVNKSIEAYTNAIKKIQEAGGHLTETSKKELDDLLSSARLAIKEAKGQQTSARENRQKNVDTEKVVAGNDLEKQMASFAKAGALTDEIKQKYEDLKASLADVSTGPQLDTWRDKLDAVNSEAQAVKAQMDLLKQSAKFEIDTRNVQTDLDNIKKKYQEILNTHPDKQSNDIEQHFEKIQQAINTMTPQNISLVRAEMTGLRREVNGLQPQFQSLSQVLQQSFGGVGQYLARFTSAFYLINKGVQAVRSMVSEVKSLDSALVSLQKVTNLTGSALSSFTNQAYEIGKSLGRTGQDVIEATATFSRAGYDLQEATDLAKSALVMSNVGVDIESMESAASDMISILKAFDIQAEDSMEVIDKLYNVSNKEPLDFGNLTQMLVTAGGTLAQTGTTLNETMALLTGGFATLRNSSVANGLMLAHCYSNVA